MLNKNRGSDAKKCWMTLTWLSVWYYKATLAVDTVNNLISFSPAAPVEGEEETRDAPSIAHHAPPAEAVIVHAER